MDTKTPPTPISVLDADGNVRPFRDIRRDILKSAIAACGDNASAAMKRLRYTRSTFYRHIKEPSRV